MDNFDIPIFKKSYDLYQTFHSYRDMVKKRDRHTIWERSENAILDVIEGILAASEVPKTEKLSILKHVSVKLNLLRVFFRLAKDSKVIDAKKYMALEEKIDEIGRMLGGWIKSVKE
ncbi:MAG TPA: diversity-generating retroelement protein Avd [Candidatus Paceibacterota bacterium]|nr:diversity-generating retroelement protein Avd [Candidatus Paceibacterota bacterium]